jgi:hypothetical protein
MPSCSGLPSQDRGIEHVQVRLLLEYEKVRTGTLGSGAQLLDGGIDVVDRHGVLK